MERNLRKWVWFSMFFSISTITSHPRSEVKTLYKLLYFLEKPTNARLGVIQILLYFASAVLEPDPCFTKKTENQCLENVSAQRGGKSRVATDGTGPRAHRASLRSMSLVLNDTWAGREIKVSQTILFFQKCGNILPETVNRMQTGIKRYKHFRTLSEHLQSIFMYYL